MRASSFFVVPASRVIFLLEDVDLLPGQRKNLRFLMPVKYAMVSTGLR